ncbi:MULTISPECIES: L,D-transpeptidase [unclassified Nocardioides]|uniref:L,D-transpeptidase n=1 Tax=unclassified Nocardioides TaxID=2615069 RepID=UPI003014FCF5
MSRHKATSVRPRYGRISVLGASLAVTLVAVLGGTGALPAALSGAGSPSAAIARDDPAPAAADPTPSGTPAPSTETQADTQAEVETQAEPEVDPAADTTLPADSGSGRRIVFSESRQRVWLIEDDEQVRRTYLASGSLTDNLDPGTYDVYSRSEDAVGIDDSGTMKYFVRFTRGDTGAAIGFHDIPVDEGKRVQTLAQLGTPQSHGCIRQKRSDAIALWDFAPLGTTVVVTA